MRPTTQVNLTEVLQNLDAEDAEVTTVERFTPAYFDLVAANTTAENAVLSAQADDERLLVELRGVTYLIE